MSTKPLLAAIGASLALFLAGCGGSSSSSTTTSASTTATTTTTSDLQAANGPLVGNPTLIAGEQSCVQSAPNQPWFATMAAFEVHDSARTHLYACAHFLGSSTSSNNVLAYESTDVYPKRHTTSSPRARTTSTSTAAATATTRPRRGRWSRASSRAR